MAERVKMVNGNIIKVFTREEINKELIRKGDWGIEYYVPGRILNPYFITINKEKFRFNTLDEVERLCKAYNKKTLQSMNYDEIRKAISGIYV